MSVNGNQPTRGQVTAVFSPQGGVGSSFLATHLAFANASGRHLLLDLAGPFGSSDLILDVAPQKSWADLLPVMAELTPSLLERASTPVQEKGELLAASPHLWQESMTGPCLGTILNTARPHYEGIVIDLPSTLQEPAATALREADQIAFLFRLDLPGLYRSQRALEVLEQWQLRPKVRLIGVETPQPKALHRGEVESLIGPLWATLPWEPEAVTKAINLGDPFRLRHRPLQEALDHLIRRWHGSDMAPEPSKRPVSRLRLNFRRSPSRSVEA